MQAINLDIYSLSLLTAKEDVLNPRSSINWAIFAYDGITNNLKLFDSGAGGLSDLVGRFPPDCPLYGLCRVVPEDTGQSCIVLIAWVGEEVEDLRRVECASHVPAIRGFFKEAHVFLSAGSTEEITEERVLDMFTKEKEETVGSEYMGMITGAEIWKLNRDSFWAHAEREEQERREEERKRAAEEKRRREKERIQQERWNAEERQRKMNEKEEMVQKQRNLQDQIEAGNCKQERLRWEQRQREHEQATRGDLAHTDSIQRVAEAAALLSQRSANPREFFKQLTTSFSSSSPSPTSSSPPKVRPKFRPPQQSLTDTCFIFGKIEHSAPPMVSPSISSKSSGLICSQQISVEPNAALPVPPQVSPLTPLPLPWTPLVPSQTLSLPQVSHSSLIPCKLRELEAEFTEAQGESVGIEVDIEVRKMGEITATSMDKREEEDKVPEQGIEERGGMCVMKAVIYEDEGMEGIEENDEKGIEKETVACKTNEEEAEERVGKEDILDGKEGTRSTTSAIELDTSLEGSGYSPETPPIKPASEEQHYFTQIFSDLHPTFSVFGPPSEESLSGPGRSASTMEITSTSYNPMSQCTASLSIQTIPVPIPFVALEENQPGLDINLEMESLDEEGQEVLVEEEEEEPSIKMVTDEEGLDPEFHPLNGLSTSRACVKLNDSGTGTITNI